MSRAPSFVVVVFGCAACGPYPGVAVLGATDAQQVVVDGVFRSWKEVVRRQPFLQRVEFVDQIDTDIGSGRGLHSGNRIYLRRDLGDVPLLEVLHHEMGHAFDFSRPSAFSSESHWLAYAGEEDHFDRGKERFASTAGLGPDGLRLVPEPGATECQLHELSDDAAVVRADLFRAEPDTFQPAAPIARTIRLPTGAWVQGYDAFGDEGVRFDFVFEDDRQSGTIYIPDLDLPELYLSVFGTPWADLYVPGGGEALAEDPVPPTWVPGIGAPLETPTPIGDGSRQIAHVSLDNTQSVLERDQMRLTIETTVDGGEVVAVHAYDCPSLNSLNMGEYSLIRTTSDGVWLLNALRLGEDVTMRFFPRDGVPRPPERWTVEHEPLTVVRER